MDDVGLYGAERFVSDHDEDLLLFLQVDEVTEPRLLSQSAGGRQEDVFICSSFILTEVSDAFLLKQLHIQKRNPNLMGNSKVQTFDNMHLKMTF